MQEAADFKSRITLQQSSACKSRKTEIDKKAFLYDFLMIYIYIVIFIIILFLQTKFFFGQIFSNVIMVP